MAICNSSEKKIYSLNMSLFSSLKKKNRKLQISLKPFVTSKQAIMLNRQLTLEIFQKLELRGSSWLT